MLQYSYLSLPYHQWVVDIHIAENIMLNNVGDSDLALRKIKLKKKNRICIFKKQIWILSSYHVSLKVFF